MDGGANERGVVDFLGIDNVCAPMSCRRREYGPEGSTPLVSRELTSLCDGRVFLLLIYNG